MKEIGFDMEKRMKMMNQKEFIKFGYQQNIIPTLIPNEEMVHLFHEILRQRHAQEDDRIMSIDYNHFKKAIVRIAALGQDLLGGQKEDLLQEKLNKERSKNENEAKKKKKAPAPDATLARAPEEEAKG